MDFTNQQIHPLNKYFENQTVDHRWPEGLPIQLAIDAMALLNHHYAIGVFDGKPWDMLTAALDIENKDQLQEACWIFSRVRSIESYSKVSNFLMDDSPQYTNGRPHYVVGGLFNYPQDVYRGIRLEFDIDPITKKISSLWAAIDGIIPQPTIEHSLDVINFDDVRRQAHPAVDTVFSLLKNGCDQEVIADHRYLLKGDPNTIDLVYHASTVQRPETIYIERLTHSISTKGEAIDLPSDDDTLNVIFERPMKWDDSRDGHLRTIFYLQNEVDFRSIDDEKRWVVRKIHSSVQILGEDVKPWLTEYIYHQLTSGSRLILK